MADIDIVELNNYELSSEDKLKLLIIVFIRKGISLDIFKFIYKSHFSKNIIYPKKYAILLRHVESNECQQLHQLKLKDMIGTFIDDPRFIAYVNSQNEIFARLYKNHYIDGVKIFRLMDNLESLAMSWLMTLYH